MIKSHLTTLIIQAVNQAFPEASVTDFTLTHPEDETRGDYASNVAFVLAKQVNLAPLPTAEKIAAAFSSDPAILKVEAAAPGFLNITLQPDYFLTTLAEALAAGESYGSSTLGAGRQIMLEFGTANTHKIPHIGHLFSYTYGESAARLLEFVGYDVIRDNYQGDVGPHVAKCLWAFQRNNLDTSGMDLSAKIAYLQECYQQGSLAYDEDPEAKTAINQLNTKIYQRDPSVLADWEETRSWSLEYYQQFEARIGARFNKNYFESNIHALGTEIVRANIGKVFEESDGAVIFRGEPYGLHTRVFINQQGNPTYEAKDVGLITQKKQDYTFDTAIVTTAVEQSEYFKVVLQAIHLIYPELKGKLKHIGFGLLNLTIGKMSSRTGNIVTAFSLVEIVKERVRQYIQEHRNYTPEEQERIAELVAIGAIKYSFLKSTATKNMTFDLESSIAFDGNSGPYLQYTYARIQSVLKKADQPAGELPTTLNPEELSVLRWLDRFPAVVEEAAETNAPHVLANYLFEIAQRYSYFYNQHQILSDDPKTTALRLQLTQAVGTVLKNGLNLLGIEVADKI